MWFGLSTQQKTTSRHIFIHPLQWGHDTSYHMTCRQKKRKEKKAQGQHVSLTWAIPIFFVSFFMQLLTNTTLYCIIGMGAGYGTFKSGIGIAGMGTFRPELMMKVNWFKRLSVWQPRHDFRCSCVTFRTFTHLTNMKSGANLTTGFFDIGLHFW